MIELCERPIALLIFDRFGSEASSARDSVNLFHRRGGAKQIRPMTKPVFPSAKIAWKQLGPNFKAQIDNEIRGRFRI
jgi:hypothetical protein